MNHGKISKILCMISAFYIALVPETIFSAIFWLLYTAGAIFGIKHFSKTLDKETKQMYTVWLILDIYAFLRLFFNAWAGISFIAIVAVLKISLRFARAFMKFFDRVLKILEMRWI